MITNLDPASELFLSNVNTIQQKLSDANRQITSGKKITTASDAPDQIDALLQLRADQSRNTQLQSNLILSKTDADAADNSLSGAIKLMENALVLANQGANYTQTADTRKSIAQQVDAMLQQMTGYSQTQVQGRYIFSGDQDGSPAYAYDAAAANGVDQVSTAQATRLVEDPAGGSFAVSKFAQEIFDNRNPDGSFAQDNVFKALNDLKTALNANDIPGISTSIDAVKQASNHLNNMEAFYGNVQNRIQAATDFASSYDIQLKTEIGQKEDADVTAAALELTQAGTQLQAAFQMQGKMPRTTLFDFLG